MLDAIRQSLRRWAGRPLVAAAIVVTVACGIGLVTAIFSLIDNLLWRPMTSFLHPEQVVLVQQEVDQAKVQGGARFQPLALEDFRLVGSDIGSFSQVVATQVIRVLWRGEKETRRLDGEMVSAGYFDFSGVPLALGRGFTVEEDRAPDTAPVVVLSHNFWRQDFAADPAILGRQIELNSHAFTVVGVAAAGFTGTNHFNPADVWVPLMMYPRVFVAPQLVPRRDGRFLRVFARLGSGRGINAARSELSALATRLAQELPASHGHLGLVARSLVGGPASALQEGIRRGATVLLAIALALLLIASSNIANLLLVRARARRGEMALRMALGAGRARLARAELGDALLLTLFGSGLGLLVGWAFRQVLWAMRPPYLDSQILENGFSPQVILFASGVAILVGILFAVAPMLSLRQVELAALMRGEAAATPARSRWFSWLSRQALVIFQVALATGVLGVAGLFLVHLLASQQIDPGFETRGLVLASFDLQNDGMEPERIAAFQKSLVERAGGLPGVSSVAVAENGVLGGFRLWRTIATEGNEEQKSTVGSGAVDGAFHQTVGIASLAGRFFTPADSQGAQVAILNRALARQLFGDESSAIGRRVVVDDAAERFEVVGVVQDSTVMTLGEDPMPFLYLPLDRFQSRRFTLHLRTSEPRQTLAALRSAIAQVDRWVPIESLATVEDKLREALWMQRLSATLLVVLGLLGLFLAGLGVYGVTAADTQQRRREIGVRLAIGATRFQVIGGILKRGLLSVLVGVAIGLGICFAASTFVRGLLYDAGEMHFPLMGAVTLLLAAVAGWAHLLPALQAARIDPARTLREG